MPDWQAISRALADHGRGTSAGANPRPVRGGDINAAWRLETDGGALFVKTGPAAAYDMFDAEADGLAELGGVGVVRVPDVVAVGTTKRDAFIAMEWLDLEGKSARAEQQLGAQLAALHRHVERRFGWYRDNTIGLTPQLNSWCADWVDFFRRERLDYQLELAARNGHSAELQSLGRRLSDGLGALFVDYEPQPSLLHGDLWGGNWAVADGGPVLIDPAVYYGDRESDLAMTQLFGGFGVAFYRAYEDAWPLETGSGARLTLYQLYHLLNHLNLFGSSYLGSVLTNLKALCRTL